MASGDADKNQLYFGDNLHVLRKYVADESVDLVYLDPPFNSNRNYSVIFNKHGEVDAAAQIEAFEDTWHWTPDTETEFNAFVTTAAGSVADVLTAFRTMLGENDAMAYLVNMAPRLVELHRVLKPTGSLYLHCDPTMSHYLKVLLDGIFDVRSFKNEIIWRRTGAHSPGRKFGPIHDVILFYTKAQGTAGFYFNPQKTPYTVEHVKSRYTQQPDGQWKFTSGGNILTGSGIREGESGMPWRGVDPTSKNRHWAIPGYVDEQLSDDEQQLGVLDKLEAAYQKGLIEIIPGRAWPEPVRYLDDEGGSPMGDIWAYQPGTSGVLAGTADSIDSDVAYLGPTSPERLGYPTQKPMGLLERILKSSCPEEGVVLDPFCGCGTTIDAAQKLGRRWIGIDITYISVDLIIKRLQHTYGNDITQTFVTAGIPQDYAAAHAMFTKDAFEFERWAVSLVAAQPNQKQVGDKGVDGVGRFILGRGEVGKVLVSVKGGKTINPGMVRDLAGTVKAQGAQLGIFITLAPPTKGVTDAINHGGVWKHPANGEVFPVLQHVTIKDLMQGRRPKLPTMYKPYIEAKRQKVAAEMDSLW
ncbi:DNA methyltransferase [Mycolicibacter virginiensis]|uniref:DNA methyltransferase n=1 Tax=Mycolicibacter virginiensis TaxID=1795032 RepID=UPI001F03A182|nr:DNA methyltransferase [Mycolicibacter virginiensis]ULP45902.1 DNA methyltransferase [Mycolicibacter virginiensis]